MDKKLVGVNERGLRVGEDHQRAKLTDADVERMRQMHEVDGLGYRVLTRIFECSKSHVRSICTYRVRCQAPATWRNVAG